MPPSTTAGKKVLSIPESKIKTQARLNGVIQGDNTTLYFIKKKEREKKNAQNNFKKYSKEATNTMGPALASRAQWGRSASRVMCLSLVKSLPEQSGLLERQQSHGNGTSTKLAGTSSLTM